MLKKILFTSIAIAISLNANSIKAEYIDCSETFEECIVSCTKPDTDSICVEKCEMLYDKCLLMQETDPETDLSFEEQYQPEDSDNESKEKANNENSDELEENSHYQDFSKDSNDKSDEKSNKPINKK